MGLINPNAGVLVVGGRSPEHAAAQRIIASGLRLDPCRFNV